MARMDLLFVLAVFLLGASILELDYVEAILRLDDIADLTGLQCKGSFFKLRNHLAWSKPTQISALVFVTGIGRVLGRQLVKIFARLHAFKNFFRLGTRLLCIELGMFCYVVVDFLVG